MKHSQVVSLSEVLVSFPKSIFKLLILRLHFIANIMLINLFVIPNTLIDRFKGSLRGRRTKGREGGGKLNASAKRDRLALVGNACHDAIVFFVFYVHQMDAKILIGQN